MLRFLLPLFVVSALASAQTINQLGLNYTAPVGWSSTVTDSSIMVSSSNEAGGAVVIGVQVASSLAPWTKEDVWIDQTAWSFQQVLLARNGRLLSPGTRSQFQGEASYELNYLGYDFATKMFYAGYSRLVTHQGKGYEFFIIGDTAAVFDGFLKYKGMLDQFQFTGSLGVHSKGAASERSRALEIGVDATGRRLNRKSTGMSQRGLLPLVIPVGSNHQLTIAPSAFLR